MTRIFLFGLAIALGVALGPGTAASQAPKPPANGQPEVETLQRIAAVVNEDVVSVFDLNARLRLVIVSSGLKDTPQVRRRLAPQVLRTLIDERLQLQEAERLDITVSDEEIKMAFAQLARANEIAPDRFETFLAENGIERSTLESQVRANIAWSKVVQQRIRPTVEIGEDEIDAVVERIERSRGRPQHLVAEIFLALDSPEQAPEVRQTANRLLEQIRNGASFSALARQFSQGASANAGGDIGWVQAGQLDPELDKALATMEPGEIYGPVRTISGYHILYLRDRRKPAADGEQETTVSLHQIHFALPPEASPEEVESQTQLARTVSDSVSGCADMLSLGEEVGSPLSGDLGEVKLGDLPDNLRARVSDLDIGEASAPVRTDQGLLVLMVCDRTEPPPTVPDRTDVAETLSRNRLDQLSRRYLRDLRRAAFVDLRV